MKYEDLKIGETYNVRVKVNGTNLAKNAICVWDCGGLPCYFRLEDVSPISPVLSPSFSTRAAGPFTVEGDADEKEFSVVLGSRFVASFPYGRGSFYTEPGAKAAAQAECDRLNEQYRKEQS